MKCLVCKENLEITLFEIISGRSGKEVACGNCDARLKANVTPIFLAIFSTGIIKLFSYILFTIELGNIFYFVSCAAFYLMFASLIPLSIVKTGTVERKVKILWYQSPVPYLAIGLLTAFYFMFWA